jgi:reverse transcriptase-like protein
MIQVILALVQAKKYLIKQMDIKEAYLNGTLKETIYMNQPKGFNNRTNYVCQLLKTLYSLKQSGREWNQELDHKM